MRAYNLVSYLPDVDRGRLPVMGFTKVFKTYSFKTAKNCPVHIIAEKIPERPDIR